MSKGKVIAISSIIIIAIFTYMISWYYAVLWMYTVIFWNTNAIYTNTDATCDIIPWFNISRQCTSPTSSSNSGYILSTKKDTLDKKVLSDWINESMESNQFNKTVWGIIAERYWYDGNELLKDNHYFIRHYSSFWSGKIIEAVKQNPKNYYYISDKDRQTINLVKDTDTIEIMDIDTLKSRLDKWDKIESMVISDSIRSNSWIILSLLEKEPLIYTFASNSLLWNKEFITRILWNKNAKIEKDLMAYLPNNLSNDKDIFNLAIKRIKQSWIIVGNELLNDHEFMKENGHLIEVLIIPDYVFQSYDMVKSFFKKSNSLWGTAWMISMLSDSDFLKNKDIQSAIFFDNKSGNYDAVVAYAIFPKKYVPSIKENFQKDYSIYDWKTNMQKYYICMMSRKYELEGWQKECRLHFLNYMKDTWGGFEQFESDLKDDLSWPDILKILF